MAFLPHFTLGNLRRLAAVCATVLLASCGGSGESPSTDTTAQNNQTSFLLAKKTKYSPPAPISSASPTPTSSSTVVPAEFFGMHLAAQTYDGWPSVNFATQRIWDSWPGVAWSDLNPSQGTYTWANLDALVNDSLSHGVELVYTFGYVPAWASSNPGGSCDGNSNGGCYAPNMQAWKDFVTQITTRYKGKIKYWELWNEPNASNFWKGTPAELVAMAKEAYTIIKNSGGIVLTPAPQGSGSPAWMDAYLGAGGGAYADIVTFHGYLHDAPEALIPLVDNMRGVQGKYGLSALPLWDTEHSWGDTTWPMGADQDQQSAWLARYLALSYTKEIQRSFWYGWEHFNWGTLYDRTTKQILKPGIAYREVYNWMVGAAFSPCTANGNVYQCDISRANGYQAKMIWSTGSPASYIVPNGYVRQKTIDAQSVAVTGGQTISVGMKPVLIENQ